MNLESAKLIGAGLCIIALAGAAAGAGLVFAAFINSVSRNPSLRNQLFPLTILSFSLCEAIGLFAMMFAFLMLFAF
jgi:F-type H+-transporting ATPase subunit c